MDDGVRCIAGVWIPFFLLILMLSTEKVHVVLLAHYVYLPFCAEGELFAIDDSLGPVLRLGCTARALRMLLERFFENRLWRAFLSFPSLRARSLFLRHETALILFARPHFCSALREHLYFTVHISLLCLVHDDVHYSARPHHTTAVTLLQSVANPSAGLHVHLDNQGPGSHLLRLHPRKTTLRMLACPCLSASCRNS